MLCCPRASILTPRDFGPKLRTTSQMAQGFTFATDPRDRLGAGVLEELAHTKRCENRNQSTAMAIHDRVTRCLEHLQKGEAEDAFIHLCIAIDGTAKKCYPGKKTSVRCKSFLRDNLAFVLWSLTNGTPTRVKHLSFCFQDEGAPSGEVEFEDLVYKAMRCSLFHEGSLPDNVTFSPVDAIVMNEGRLIFPYALLGALAFAVMSSPSNADERPTQNIQLKFGDSTFDMRDLWGDREATKSAIRNGFQYDVEEMLQALTKEP